jgi:hypothetical protein
MSTQKHEFDFINLLNRNSKVIIAVCSRFCDYVFLFLRSFGVREFYLGE